MRDFCSRPLPEFVVSQKPGGWAQADVVSRGLGNSSAITIFIGQVTRKFAPRPLGCPAAHFFAAQVTKPCEVFIRDLFVHEDLWSEPHPPGVRVFGSLRGADTLLERDPGDLLPVQEKVVELGRGPGAALSPDVARYPELLEYSFGRLGWDADRFRVFRCRVEYPVLNSLISVEFDEPGSSTR